MRSIGCVLVSRVMLGFLSDTLRSAYPCIPHMAGKAEVSTKAPRMP